MNILIVDDSFITRQFLKKTLSPLGECDVAVNGEEAVLAHKLAFEAQRRYNLICMDFVMPVMDGIQALRAIRSFEEASRISIANQVGVIMITASDDPKTSLYQKSVFGKTSVLIKPFTDEDLLREIVNLGVYRHM